MRLHVTYPGSGPHEVELLGRVSIVGRDPSCDLVIHDVKCSRRHAVLETGPDGVTVRDSGSANGVYLNGQRIERTILKPGDLLTLGEVQIQLLPEAVEATMLASADNMATISPGQMAGLTAPAPPPDGATSAAPVAAAAPPPAPVVAAPPPPAVAAPPPAPPAPGAAPPGGGSYSISGQTDSGKLRADAVKSEMAAMEAREKEAAAAAPAAATPAEPAGPRPLTVTLLAVLWLASILLYLGNGVYAAIKMGGLPGIGVAVVCALFALVAAVMALGLFMVKPWARILQIIIAGIGLLTCSFTLASAVTIFYMLRAGVKARFAGSGNGDEKEGLFAALLLGTVLLGAIAAGGGMYMASMRMAAAPPFPQP